MFRVAGEADLVALLDLERAANLVGLGHVFPPERYPFPDDAVLARWRIVLDDPDVEVLVNDDPAAEGIIAYAAYDATTLRHLAVHPDHWGVGLATAAVEAAESAIAQRGSTSALLWCLEENHRARRLYEHLGWRPTGRTQEAQWPPHPVETEYRKTLRRPTAERATMSPWT